MKCYKSLMAHGHVRVKLTSEFVLFSLCPASYSISDFD